MHEYCLQFEAILRSSMKQAELLCPHLLAPGLGRASLRAMFAG